MRGDADTGQREPGQPALTEPEVFRGLCGVLRQVGRDPFGSQLAGAADDLDVDLLSEPEDNRVRLGYESIVSTPKKPVDRNSIRRPLYLVALVTSVVFGLLNLVVAVWGAFRGESLGHVLAVLVRLVPFVASGVYARWLYVRGPDYQPNQRGGMPH